MPNPNSIQKRFVGFLSLEQQSFLVSFSYHFLCQIMVSKKTVQIVIILYISIKLIDNSF